MAGEIVVIHSTTSFAQKMSNRIKRLQMMDFKKMVSGLWQSGALSAFIGGCCWRRMHRHNKSSHD
jgi:hypothetical protein